MISRMKNGGVTPTKRDIRFYFSFTFSDHKFFFLIEDSTIYVTSDLPSLPGLGTSMLFTSSGGVI